MDTGKDLDDLSSETTQLAHSWAKETSTVSEEASRQDWELQLTWGVCGHLHHTAEAKMTQQQLSFRGSWMELGTCYCALKASLNTELKSA